MNQLSLLEFQRLSGLSDRALLWLLVNNKLPISIEQRSGIRINSDGFDFESIIQSMRSQSRDQFKAHRALIEERLAALMAEKLDELLEDIMNRLRSEA